MVMNRMDRAGFEAVLDNMNVHRNLTVQKDLISNNTVKKNNNDTFSPTKLTNRFSPKLNPRFMNDIYSLDRRIEGGLRRLNRVSKDNKKTIVRFYNYCLARGMSKARISVILIVLNKLDKLLGKPFQKVEREDLIKVVGYIESNGYSSSTKAGYKIVIKQFWKWLKDREGILDGYPVLVKWIKVSPRKKRKMPEEILTVEEVERLVEYTGNIRDKTMIAILYESGCRIGELLSLKIKNVQFDEHGGILLVHGKTGYRRVRIIQSARFLKRWINVHPFKDIPEGYLWISVRYNNRPMKYAGFHSMLKKMARKIHLNKRIYPHLFRHSRATHLANYLTEAQMNIYFGWVQGSNMPRTYVHLSGRDIDEAILRLNGIKI